MLDGAAGRVWWSRGLWDETLARRREDGQLAGVLVLTARALYVVGDGRRATGDWRALGAWRVRQVRRWHGRER
jgi:hypothetical protein